ncbi:MAG: DUF58 domain-containing protein [Desulfuromonas sp.]|nr:DUF58 domain-containing protein [Desulfuromonas sp.]
MNPSASKKPSNPRIAIDLPGLIALRRQVDAGLHRPLRSLARQDGGYRSPFRGRGMEFSEVRSYQNGDDIRTIDWRVTARTGKPHTKLFHEERERPVLVALDYRRPMFFATRGSFKAVQASQLAALIGWQALANSDRLGAFLFSEERHVELRPQSGKRGVLAMLRQMVNAPAWQRELHQPFDPQQRLHQTLARLHRVARPGSLVTLISDFAQWDDNVEKQLTLLGRHCQLQLILCYDIMETSLPTAGVYPLSNGQQPLQLDTGNRPFRDHYSAQFEAHRQRLQQFCQRSRARFFTCATSDNPVECLRGQTAGGQR